MGRPCKYNIDKDQAIKLLIQDKLSIPLAAHKLRCSSDSLRTFVQNNNIDLPNQRVSRATPSINKVDPQVVQSLLAERKTFREIADLYSCKESAVANFVKAHKLVVTRYNPNPAEAELRQLYCEKLLSLDEIGQYFGISSDRVSRCLKHYSIKRTKYQQHCFDRKVASIISDKQYQKSVSNLPDAAVLHTELESCKLCEVISKYGSSKSAIKRYLQEAGLEMPQHKSVPTIATLQKWLNDGLLLNDISQLCGFSTATVSKWIKDSKLVRSDEGMGIYKQARSNSARNATLLSHSSTLPTADELQECVNSYLNFHEIAQKYGCGDSVIGKCIKRYCVKLPCDYRQVVTERYIQRGKDTTLNRYGVFPYALTAYSEIAQQTLTDKDNFCRLVESIPLKDRTWARIASELGVPDYLVKSYYQRYQLTCEISKALGSSLEEQLRRFLDNNSLQYTRNDRSLISPQELDFYFAGCNVAIEVNGNWSHSVTSSGKYAPVTRDYHINKTRRCLGKGIRLIHLFEYEMSNTSQWHKLQKFIVTCLATSSTIYARKCKVLKVDSCEEKTFLNEFHLQGYVPSSVCYGLYHQGELVSVMSFGKPRFHNSYEYELLRLCTKFGTVVVGGANKLFAHFLRECNPDSIISYCDLSKFTGSVYTKLGMHLLRISSPNYKWVRFTQTYSRYQTQKHKLSKLLGDAFDPQLSESDNMIKAGFVKIYDCGNAVYEWRK